MALRPCGIIAFLSNQLLGREQSSMRCAYAWSFVFGVVLWPLAGRTQQFDIGQMHYMLGMTMSQVQAATHDRIYLDIPGNYTQTAMWVVREKRREQEFVLIGTIAFTNGRVDKLERNLKSFSTDEARSVGDALFRTVDQLKREDPNANVSAASKFVSSASGEVLMIKIGAGPRRTSCLV